MERIDNIDLEATTARARRMTDEELIWSVYDAAEKKKPKRPFKFERSSGRYR
jgi:hypothetical protein